MSRRCATFCYRACLPNHVFSAKTITRLLKRHLDEPVKNGGRALVLRRWQDAHLEVFNYHVVSA